MIQYFDVFINHLIEDVNKLNNLEYLDYAKYRYKEAYDEVVIPNFIKSLPTTKCPASNPKIKCGAIGSLSCNSKYKRAVIRDIINGEIVEYNDVEIKQYICLRCESTHALLVWFLPPWSRHSLRFIFFVLEMYYMRKKTVEAICIEFDITHPTLYEWNRKYREQYDDLRILFNPPILPDIPQKFEQWLRP